jgi:hypothetical protein|tara:strand:- start:1146 stop:1469 length:324 start_codon:yes stop_codon:yes gene_type:complete
MDAYLDTLPDESKSTRRNSWMAGVPKVGALSYLQEIFVQTGQVVADAGGQLRALNWPDIAGYIAATGQKLEAWESRALIDLSMTYLVEHYRAKNPRAITPYAERITR